MANYKAQFVLIALSLLNLIQIGTSLKCYNCTEVTNKNCRNPKGDNIQTVTCDDASHVCIKHERPEAYIKIDKNTKTNIPSAIDRGCKPKEYCETVKNFSWNCSTCNTHLCNSVSELQVSFIVLALCLLKFLM